MCGTLVQTARRLTQPDTRGRWGHGPCGQEFRRAPWRARPSSPVPEEGKGCQAVQRPVGASWENPGAGKSVKSSPSDLLPAAKNQKRAVRLLSEEGHSTLCLGESARLLQVPSAEDGRHTAWCEPSAGLGGHSRACSGGTHDPA